MRLAFLVLLVGACHSGPGVDDLVGATCVSDTDCRDRCFTDGNDHFPGGFCSLPCESDFDCPVDTACVTTAGGVCMFGCDRIHCSALGPGWTCKDVDRKTGGKVQVCIGG
jgi:hypothetical protein